MFVPSIIKKLNLLFCINKDAFQCWNQGKIGRSRGYDAGGAASFNSVFDGVRV